jgi:nicotinamide riboside kinase
MSKLICIVGAPSSGKSTLAASIHYQLKKKGLNSIFVTEAATDYIAEWGIPNTPIDQMVIFYKQLNREKMYMGSKDYIICDSSSILNYFYFRSLYPKKLSNKDVAAINHLQKEILKNINQWYKIYYIPPILDNVEDGIRFQNKDEIARLDNVIRDYLILENIDHTDLSDINIDERCKYIFKDIV